MVAAARRAGISVAAHGEGFNLVTTGQTEALDAVGSTTPASKASRKSAGIERSMSKFE
jgi:hypothetical protein